MFDDYLPQANPTQHQIHTMHVVRSLFRYNKQMIEQVIAPSVHHIEGKTILALTLFESSIMTIFHFLMVLDKVHPNLLASMEQSEEDLKTIVEIFREFDLRRVDTSYVNKIPGETMVKIHRDLELLGNRLNQLTIQTKYLKELEDKRAKAAPRLVKPTPPPIRMIKEGAMPPGWESRKRWWWPF